MAATQTTQHYQLPIYQPDDVTSWLTDFNGAMQKIDQAIYNASQGGGSGINVVQETGESTTNVMSQNATTIAINNVQQAIPAVLDTTGDSESATMSQKAITEVITGGGNKKIYTLSKSTYSTTSQTRYTIPNITPGTYKIKVSLNCTAGAGSSTSGVFYAIYDNYPSGNTLANMAASLPGSHGAPQATLEASAIVTTTTSQLIIGMAVNQQLTEATGYISVEKVEPIALDPSN